MMAEICEENLDDLDMLVDLLDKEEDSDTFHLPTTTAQQKTNSQDSLCNNENNKLAIHPNVLNKADSNSMNKLSNPRKSSQDTKRESSPSTSTAHQSKSVTDSNLDPLEAELLAMEEKMMALRKKLASKKKSGKIAKDPPTKKIVLTKEKSEIHAGDTDSDEDEDNRNPFEPHLTSSGRDIKKRLAHSNNSTSELKRKEIVDRLKGRDNPMANWSTANNSLLPAGTCKVDDPSCAKDPFSGIRIMNPLVTAATMKEMMDGRRMIAMSSLSSHMRGGEIDGDWVSIGVIVSKSETKKSQKGTQYCIWQMSDLKDCTKVVSLFLFAGAYKSLWKTSVGSVAGILNPQIMKDRGDGKRDSITLSVNNHQNVLLMGTSKDLGWCQGRTKQQGSRCHQFVNKNVCEFCIFHIQREYQKTCAKRSDIQSSFSRVDPQKALRKKIFGKDQVFYGGQLFTPGKEITPPTKKQRSAHRGKDLATLSSLSSLKMKLKSQEIKEEDKRNSFILNSLSDKQISTVKETIKENEGMGQLLLAPTPGARNLLKHLANEEKETNKSSESSAKELSAKELLKLTEKEKSKNMVMPVKSPFGSSPSCHVPVLGRGLKPNSEVDLCTISPRDRSKVAKKLRAAMILKDQGGVKPTEKNFQQSKEKISSDAYKENIKKRLLDTPCTKDEGKRPSKFPKKEEKPTASSSSEGKSLLGSVDLNSDKFKKILEAKSKHTNLIQDVEDTEMDKYYNSLEKKEMLEDKMASIMEVPTNAVSCLKCKYTTFSASELCRSENHPLKTIKATKRFFECKNCKQRTVSLDKLPHHPCSHCQHSSWIRAPMGKGRKGPQLESEVLSLRGNELNSYGSASGQIFLHL